MSDSFSKAQARVFALHRKNNNSDEHQTETKDDAKKSGSLVEYLNELLIALSNLDTDMSRLLVVANQNNLVSIKSLTELPKINTTEIKKLLNNTSVVKDFNSSRAELSVIDEVKAKFAEIKKIGVNIANTNRLIRTSSRHYITERPTGQKGASSDKWTINQSLIIILKETFESIHGDVLPKLNEFALTLKQKLEQLTVKKMVGAGYNRPYQLKYDPMYQSRNLRYY
jgi:hypothetical protein